MGRVVPQAGAAKAALPKRVRDRAANRRFPDPRIETSAVTVDRACQGGFSPPPQHDFKYPVSQGRWGSLLRDRIGSPHLGRAQKSRNFALIAERAQSRLSRE